MRIIATVPLQFKDPMKTIVETEEEEEEEEEEEGRTIQWSKKNNKRTNNDLQNTTQKYKDQQHEPTKYLGIN